MEVPAHDVTNNVDLSPDEKVLALARAEGIPDAPAPADSRPAPTIFPHGTGRFEVSADGVRFVSGDGTPKRICDELRVQAKTLDVNGRWGKLLQWRDSNFKLRTWTMPERLLVGDGVELARELRDGGLQIMPGQSGRLRDYLTMAEVEERALCLDQLGWHGSAYCLADETIGNTTGERIVFQTSSTLTAEYGRAGSTDDWRDSVAALATGNSRLGFAISCAFAGPLLQLAGVESGGFHFIGGSSTGKTTALRVAASVWGHPDKYTRQWRATDNGLEGLAALHNDGLLILDELSQCDPRKAGEVAYMLANGKGKARANRTGGARESASWRVLFLSSGEVALSTHMERDGRRANAGQELRLANISADAGAGLGMFEAIHGRENASVFANELKTACAASYGTVGREYLRLLVGAEPARLREVLSAGVSNFIREAVPAGASGQVERVAQRFGLIAAAGELATHYQLTGWYEGEAVRAAKVCFNAWLEGFGVGSHEDKAIVEQVRGYIERHGSSRFQKIDAEETLTINRAGFWREVDGTRQYLVLPVPFKTELVLGFDAKCAAKVLETRGLLEPSPDRLQTKVRMPGLGATWVYVLVVPEEAA